MLISYFLVPVAGFVAWFLSFILSSYIKRPQENFYKYTDSLWYVIGALLTQGNNMIIITKYIC